MSTLKVMVNLLWLAPGRVGGSEEYLTRQLLALDPAGDTAADPAGDTAGGGAGVAIEIAASSAFAEAHPALASRVRRAPLPIDARGLRIGLEHTWLVAAARGADVVHHGGGTTPLVGQRPIVLTVHDLQYRTFPEYFSRGRLRYLEAMMPPSVRRAAVVAVPSAYVRGTVVDAFGIDPERVHVVPHPVPDVEVAEDDVVIARRRYGVADRPYVVYPAITHPHKRHEVLVEMLDHLDDVAVVLLGGAGSAEADLAAAIAASAHRDRVVRPGRVPTADRDALLAGADALVFPSRYEGFGAPLIEAMSLDVPVVASAAAAVGEVVADGGIVVPADDPEAWAAAVADARSRRAELVVAGRRRRADFTPAVAARALLAAYHHAHRGAGAS